MNARNHMLALALASVSIFAAAAQNVDTSDRSDAQGSRLRLDCRATKMPSREAVGRVVDATGGADLGSARANLWHTAQQLCRHGATYVVFVRAVEKNSAASDAEIAYGDQDDGALR